MRAFRICPASGGRTRAAGFGGNGGLHASARWHTQGRLIVYAAETLSLAALENLVHLKRTTNLQPYHYFAAEIPDELVLKPRAYPSGWQSSLAITRSFGDAWLVINEFPAVLVPTVITPNEWNILINPAHPKFSLSWVNEGPTPFAFDERLTH